MKKRLIILALLLVPFVFGTTNLCEYTLISFPSQVRETYEDICCTDCAVNEECLKPGEISGQFFCHGAKTIYKCGSTEKLAYHDNELIKPDENVLYCGNNVWSYCDDCTHPITTKNYPLGRDEAYGPWYGFCPDENDCYASGFCSSPEDYDNDWICFNHNNYGCIYDEGFGKIIGNYACYGAEGWRPKEEFESSYDCNEVDGLDPNADFRVPGAIAAIVNGNLVQYEYDTCLSNKTLKEVYCDGRIKKTIIEDCQGTEICHVDRCMSQEDYNSLYTCIGPTKDLIDYKKQSSIEGMEEGYPFELNDYCVGQTPIKMYCEENKKKIDDSFTCPDETTCFGGACLDEIEGFSGCYEGDICGNLCGQNENRCEDIEGKPEGYVPKYLEFPSNDGICIGGKCLRKGCDPEFSEDFEYCNGYVKDTDCDGIMDTDDNCPQDCRMNLYASMYNVVNTDENGCPMVDLPKTECMHLKGSGSNVNIIIVPCGFSDDKDSIFYYWTRQIANSLDTIYPFAFPENKEKYSLSYVWDTRKKDIVSGTGLDELDSCLNDEGESFKIVNEADCPSKNQVVFQLAHRAFSPEAIGYANGLHSVGTQGWGSCCPANKECCKNWDYQVISTAFHEIGHLFNLGHPDEAVTDSNNYYSYSFDQLPADSSCPIWNLPEYTLFEDLNQLKIGCYATKDSLEQNLDPKIYNSVDIETLMVSYVYVPPDNKWEYDPVSAKLINDAIQEGFDKYKRRKYPHKCEDFFEDEIAEKELGAYYKPKLSEIFKVTKKSVIQDLIVGCFESECKEAGKLRDSCCLPLKSNYGEEEYNRCMAA